MSKFATLLFLAAAVFDFAYCGVIPRGRERRQIRLDFPLGDGASLFGSVGNDGGFSGTLGATGDIFNNRHGHLYTDIFGDLGLKSSGFGGSLNFDSQAFHAKLQGEKIGNTPIISGEGMTVLYRPGKFSELNAFFSGSKALGTPGKPDINVGINYNSQF